MSLRQYIPLFVCLSICQSPSPHLFKYIDSFDFSLYNFFINTYVYVAFNRFVMLSNLSIFLILIFSTYWIHSIFYMFYWINLIMFLHLCIFSYTVAYLSSNLFICLAVSLYCNPCIHEASSKSTRRSKVKFFYPPPQTNIVLTTWLIFVPYKNQIRGLKLFCVTPPPPALHLPNMLMLTTHFQTLTRAHITKDARLTRCFNLQ